MPDIVAIVSDTHINSTVGLCPPSVNLDDGGTYNASPAQMWLWHKWKEFSVTVKTLADKHGAEVTTFFNGDLVEADAKKRSHQTITRNKADLVRIATETIAPLVDISKRAFFIRGTEAHVGKSAQYEEEIAADCSIAVKCTETVTSWWQFYGELGGVCFDISHHGRLGSLPWNRAAPLGQTAIRTLLAYAGRRVPDVVVRSHNHKYASTHDNYPVMVVATPAWQLATEYTHRLGIPEPADIGGLIFVCDGKGYTWQKAMYAPKAAAPWKLQTVKSGKR